MTTGQASPTPLTGDGSPAPPADSTIAGKTPDQGPQAPGAKPPEPVYTAIEDWVIDYFVPMFRRTLGGEYRWCAQWWQHGEAISRLTSLWHAWEVLRLQPGTGIATWYREHLDHQLPILMGARGPFYQCSETAHREPHEAATLPAPGDWWDLSDDHDDLSASPALGNDEPGDGLGASHDGA
jgi:Domain of unknown function (DUF4913)